MFLQSPYFIRVSGHSRSPAVDWDSERVACVGTGSESCSELRKRSETRPVCGECEQNKEETGPFLPQGQGHMLLTPQHDYSTMHRGGLSAFQALLKAQEVGDVLIQNHVMPLAGLLFASAADHHRELFSALRPARGGE